MYKIIGADGRVYGPVRPEVVREWILNGRADADTRVLLDGSNDWIPLSQIPEFASSLTQKRISGLAVTSIVCGAIGIFPLPTAPIGLVCGILARRRIKKSNGRFKGLGLATTGIVLSALTGMLWIFMLLSALSAAREMSNQIICVNNLRGLGLGVRMYASDNNGQFPYATNWCDAIYSDVGSAKAFQCPAAQAGQGQSSYAFNASLSGLNETNINPATVMLFETEKGWNTAGGIAQMASNRHYLVNVSLVDGSVITLQKSELNSLRWEP